MADSEYPTPDDLHFAGLVQAATAAADESRSSSSLGKRKREYKHDIPIDDSLLGPAGQSQEPVQLQNSAAVLFREPSIKSKKYSRPPLGKVYASLELAPESFLKLQAAGKDFMLDPNHPERRDVVGHRRHSGGTDVAKLRLWNCVEEFLRDAGNGDKFFAPGAGAGIPDAPERTMFWPEDAQKIIKACMPLMRKMVTNERQRIYASETRKTGGSKEPGQGQEATPEGTMTPQALDPSEDAVAATGLDGTLNQPQQMADAMQPEPPSKQVAILVNVMKNDGNTQKRMIPRFSLTNIMANNLSSLREEIKKRLKAGPRNKEWKDADLSSASIKVWMADGLVPIIDDGQWMVALLSAETVEWMDGEVRVLVEM